MNDLRQVDGEGGGSAATAVASHEGDGARARSVSSPLVRPAIREDQLITLMGLVREYTTDNDLYIALSEARP